MITVAETRMFQRKAARLLSAQEREDLVTYLAVYPNSGVIMEGTGGGKSSGVRVIYYYHDESMPLYLLTAFGRNEKSNLSKEERNLLAKAVKELVIFWRQRNAQSIH